MPLSGGRHRCMCSGLPCDGNTGRTTSSALFQTKIAVNSGLALDRILCLPFWRLCDNFKSQKKKK